ncbi:MAG: hypothetical protein GY714_03625 [Desulfobacterales bacterium]|nr:hypothetical protein [Desulfobacterales bacterium]MCP4158660.1 hypothetical protein [Deltaproteobacteria bacterium]
MKDGIIQLEGEAFKITSSLKENDFLNSGIGQKAILSVKNEGYSSYTFGPYKIKSDNFYFLLIFYSGEIHSVYMELSDLNDKIDYGADDKESALIKANKIHENWLLSNLGLPPYFYSWGSIDSAYDKKGWSAFIVLSYKQS